ncbi:glutathione S-transferase domain-containing protein [Didymella exigua CBS 183.55]|uniref:Glutathione S-transferase domain-containing protein n=1 Tax=Didymella exigua CBS 183.55 TaxID=1150837 RepID=A0A6A5RGB9_9PLEO|nr:glutathione S-transferase domain-containing protein [Didymella exigua CBS 183.55]KAF1927361.1 glutathione S-transferase domain-containing protein [Didymella exigua CBS 183.55]
MSSESLTLISATPSPFARMNRIALRLKDIPFELQNEIPWESQTQTPKYNPLEKLPILIFPKNDPRPPVYESAHIQTYIVEKYADRGPRLIPADLDGSLLAKQIVVLGVGCMDAMVLMRWEARRDQAQQSPKWVERQSRKVDGALRAFSEYAEAAEKEGRGFVVGSELSVADIAVICAIGFIDFGDVRPGWREKYAVLARYFDRLDAREEFEETRPVMFNLTEKVV